MLVERIEIANLSYVTETERFAANFCLHMTDRDTGTTSRAYLVGHAKRQPKEASDSLAARLLEDVKRQMDRMPEFALRIQRLHFAPGLTPELAA